MTTKLLGNQLRSILNEPVEGFTVELADESDMFEWRVWIEGPRDTAYQGGIFQLSLKFPKDYPMSPPELKFVSDFWHPNVFPNGKVCMSILHPPGEDAMSGELPEERWLPTQSVTTIILSLLSVLNDPNCASPANVDASVEWRNNRDAYKSKCRKLVEKANRECPAHVVIPHPESDADQHRRRVQKFREMNKDLDYEDFYAEEAEEENESGDENEFLESNEDINTDDERSPQLQHKEEAAAARKSSEESVITEPSGASEPPVKKDEDDLKPTEEREVTKPQSKGKEKAPEDSSSEEEIAVHSSSSSSAATSPLPPQVQQHQPSSTTATLTDSNISTYSNNDSSLGSSSSNNNADGVPPAGKKGKRGKKAKKCVIM